MALNQPQTLEPRTEHETELQELENLESEVMHMAQQILHYRTTLPDQLKNTFSSILAAQRSVFPLLESGSGSGSEPGPSGDPNPDAGVHVEPGKRALLAEEDQETAEKIRLLKDKISSNISAMPIVLKRMNDCISAIDKLDSYNGIVHPAFKRKRTS